jgi:hypothetical protein
MKPSSQNYRDSSRTKDQLNYSAMPLHARSDCAYKAMQNSASPDDMLTKNNVSTEEAKLSKMQQYPYKAF